jgi:hypothetical protein
MPLLDNLPHDAVVAGPLKRRFNMGTGLSNLVVNRFLRLTEKATQTILKEERH